jgi:heat shock protein HslJ
MAGGMIGLLLALQIQAAVQPPSPPPPAPTLANTQWTMTAIGQEPVSGSQYTLQINAAEIAGRAGCNSFTAPYTMAGETLTVGEARSTRMACAPGVMTREQRALSILTGAVRISRPDANTLVLTGDEGAIRLRRAN